MATDEDTTKLADDVCTLEEIVALDWEAWRHTDDEWRPPTNQQWAAAVNPHLVAIRMAWLLLFKSKLEVITMAETLSEDDTVTLLEAFIAAGKYIHAFGAVLSCAEVRLMSAASAVAMRDGATS